MPIFFYKTVLALTFVFAYAAAIIVTEDALSEHKSVRVKAVAVRVYGSVALLVALAALFFFVGSDA